MNTISQPTIGSNWWRVARPALRTSAVSACVLWSLACSPTQPTEIVAGVSTQIRVPDDLHSVGLSVQVRGEVKYCAHYRVTDGFATLPGTLGLLGETGLASRGTVTVQVVGFRSESSAFEEDCVNTRAEETGLDARVIRRRRLTFVDNQIKFLPMALKESCADNRACSDDETCVGGKCVSAELDATSLPAYDDSLIFGNGNTCFDAQRCMDSAVTVPVQLTDRETCTFRAVWPDDLPKPGPEDLNVRLFYKSFGSEVLDLDFASSKAEQREGFSFAGAGGDPLSFRLAPNLCETNYDVDEPNVLAIDASTLCTAKRALQPICEGYQPPDLHADLRPMGKPDKAGPGICTLAGLEPVESVVYVLMDHSLSMTKFFGDGGLAFAIGLPLSSPVAKRTKVGFEFLPPAAEQCGTTEYDSPTVPFANVEGSRAPIGVILAGRDAVLPDDPSQFFLEAALQGAYRGVTAVKANDETQGFNRRAVVVISNRDISTGPCPGPTAQQLAADAHAAAENPIYTYAVALDSGEPRALQSARALATAGGTNVFDGVSDEAEGARAVNDILTELGTCLYKVKRADAGGDERLPQSAHISYIDPTSPAKGVDIPFNPQCSKDAAVDVSGWKQELGSNLVRLCGQACEDLRQVIGDVGVFHAAQRLVAPAVPLVVTAPCDEFIRHEP